MLPLSADEWDTVVICRRTFETQPRLGVQREAPFEPRRLLITFDQLVNWNHMAEFSRGTQKDRQT
jgi:hypothetical protein